MADLKIKIKGDDSSLSSAINRSKSGIGRLKAGIAGIMAGPVGMALGAVAIAVGAIGVAATKAYGYLRNLSVELDGIGKSSKRIGITAEEFQKISFAARRTGATTADVERAFKRMQKTIFDAGKGLSTARDALKALGLTFEELNGLSPEKQFQILATRLNMVRDATNGAAISQDVFGRAGTKIRPLINEYADLAKELERMGGIIDDRAVKSSEKFQDELENISTQLKALSANTGAIGFLADQFEGLNLLLIDIKKNIDNINLSNFARAAGHLATTGLTGNIIESFTGSDADSTNSAAVTAQELLKAREDRRKRIEDQAKVDAESANFKPASQAKELLSKAGGALGNMGGFDTASMKSGLIGSDPILSELSKQTQYLKDIASARNYMESSGAIFERGFRRINRGIVTWTGGNNKAGN